MTTQKEVTDFYDSMVFPSRSSHRAYRDLVPDGLDGLVVGDFGCGQSLFADTFRDLGYDAVYVDIAINALHGIESEKRVNASLTDIPLRSGSMDTIFCIGVVHHIPEMEKALAELMRVLKGGGRLYLGVYREKSFQAALRKSYEALPVPLLKKLLHTLAGILIWAKNRKNGLAFRSAERRKRTDDLLLTPLARYLPTEIYEEIIEKQHGRPRETKTISSMNIIVVEKEKRAEE